MVRGLGLLLIAWLVDTELPTRGDLDPRDDLLAKAQIGDSGAWQQVLSNGDEPLIRALLAAAPAHPKYAYMHPPWLERADLGPEADAFLLLVLADTTPVVTVSSPAIARVKTSDARLDVVAAAMRASPQDYAGALGDLESALLARWGRPTVIEAWLPQLDDARPTQETWADYRLRVCDRAILRLLALTAGDHGIRPSPNRETPAQASFDTAIAAFRSWWATQPKLTPRRWLTLRVRGVPAAALPLTVTLRQPPAPDRATTLTQPRLPVEERLHNEAQSLCILIGSREVLMLPLQPPAHDETILIHAHHTAREAATIERVEHPR